MPDYAKTARRARDAFKRNGALVTLTWTPPPESDAPDAPTPAPVTLRAYGILLEYSARQLGTQANTLIQAGDKQIQLAALDENDAPIASIPPECHCDAPDGVRYVVKGVKPLAPAGLPVMFDLNIRRG